MLPSLGAATPTAEFDAYDEFVPAHLPEPGPAVAVHDVLTGEAHLAVHRTARDCFEERGVYDMTFGYNLARLNCDDRHPNAGFRYAEDRTGQTVLIASFTPTTPFCPQSHTLTVGAFRALNGLADRHDYDLVRVRIDPSHHASGRINDRLERLEAEFRETGAVPDPAEDRAPREADQGAASGGAAGRF